MLELGLTDDSLGWHADITNKRCFIYLLVKFYHEKNPRQIVADGELVFV